MAQKNQLTSNHENNLLLHNTRQESGSETS